MAVKLSALVEEWQGASMSAWSYRTTDRGALLFDDDYFQQACARLDLNDRIHCTCSGGSDYQFFTLVVVYKSNKKVGVALENPPSVR